MDYFRSKNSSNLKYQELLASLKEKGIPFNKYEMRIWNHLVHPDEIDVEFSHIGGLKEVTETIQKNIILLLQKDLSKISKYLKPPKGVLLHGPPGCGKTMIAKATAKEANARFIYLDIGELTDNGYGEAPKLAAAVFTLASKLKPCIIFIDEIDTFLRPRNREDHEATSMMKSQFMTNWDGLTSDSTGVVIMGATNNPSNIDAAILRRMPLRLLVPMPSQESRRDIIEILLKGETVFSDVSASTLSNNTENFSASDLKEMCSLAVMSQINEENIQLMKNNQHKQDNEKCKQEIIPGNVAKKEMCSLAVMNQINKEIQLKKNNQHKQDNKKCKQEIIPENVEKKEVLNIKCNMRDFDEAIKKIREMNKKLFESTPAGNGEVGQKVNTTHF